MRLLDAEYGTVCPVCGHTPVYLRAHNKKIYCPNCDPKPRKIGTITLTDMKYDRTRRDELVAAITKHLADHGFTDLKIICYPKTYATTASSAVTVDHLLSQGRPTAPWINTKLVGLPDSERLYTYKYQEHEVIRYGDNRSYGEIGFTNISYNRQFYRMYSNIRLWMNEQGIRLADPSIYKTLLNEYVVRRRARKTWETKRQNKLHIIREQIRYLKTCIDIARSTIARYDEMYGESAPSTGTVTIRIPNLHII